MKLELFSKPLINHYVIGKYMVPELVVEFDRSPKRVGDTLEILNNKFFAMSQHLHYTFYFQLEPDVLTDILCYTSIRISRNEFNKDLDEGFMSGSIEDYLHGVLTFCRKGSMIELRMFFNTLCMLFETEGVTLPFIKIDLGDKTFAVRPS